MKKLLHRIYFKLVGFRSLRRNYWSNSKFAQLIRGIVGMKKHPIGATAKEWKDITEYNKKVSPKIFWLLDTGLNLVQDVVYFPRDVYSNHKIYFVNRFIDRTHLIDTNLERGQWHEVDTVLLHGIMETLVNYVEEQCSHKGNIGHELNGEPVIKNNRDAGLDYLNWEISLETESTSQAEVAQVVKDVYLWWKDQRPQRPDVHVITGWTQFCKTHGFPWDEEYTEDKKRARELIDDITFLEIFYHNEDTEMMNKVIEVRSGLWT